MSKYDRENQVNGREHSQRGLYVYLVVLFVTASWAAMLYFGGKIIGVPIATVWLLAFAGAIFFLLLLGLGMAAVASGEDERVLLFAPPACPIAVSCHPLHQGPWEQAAHKELRLPVEQCRGHQG